MGEQTNNSQLPNPNNAKKELTRKQQAWLIAVWVLALILAWRCFDPFRAEWYYREGFNYEAGKNLTAAMHSMEKAVKLAPLETFYGVFLGKIYEDMSRQVQNKEEQLQWAQKAEDTYNYILRISPRNPWYHNRLAEIYRRYSEIYDDPKVKEAYLVSSDAKIIQAAELDKNNGLFQMSLAYMYHRKGDLDKALELYAKVLEIDPSFMEAYFNMADIWRQRGRIDKTIELYKTIVSKNPNFRNAHLSLGRIYYSQGKLKQAEEEFVEEIKVDKGNLTAYQSLGALLMQKKNWGMAERIYNRILQLNPKDTLARQYLAQCYYSLGMVDEAIAELETVLAAEPGNEQAKRNLSLMKQVRSRPKAEKKTTAEGTATGTAGAETAATANQ